VTGGAVAGGGGSSLDGLSGNSGRSDARADPPVDSGASARKPLEEVQREFAELRFGMFIHFGITTYTGEWSDPNLDIKQFNPTGPDCDQWATAAASAGMKYAVLTKHHDGLRCGPARRAASTSLPTFGAFGVPDLAPFGRVYP
jgi:hypothetical protein